MPKRQIFKKVDSTGNIEDLGFTVTQEEINSWNTITTHTHNYLPIDGTAASATKAIQDGNGKVIADTYLPLTGGAINGNLTITGNITQNGSNYITHAEEVRTTKDYIYLRDGATGSLANNSYSGFEFVKYDGTNNGRLVVDNKGIARVGDVGDEQPLATREETPTNGGFAKWDSNSSKFITDTNVATADHTHTKDDITDFSHSHSYLPLSGGTLTGTVTMNGGDFLARYVGIAAAGHETGTYDKIAIISSTSNGYVRYRTKSELASDLGVPTNVLTQADLPMFIDISND